jgi:hypothetical protein
VKPLPKCGKVIDWCISYEDASSRSLTCFLLAEGKVILPWETSLLSKPEDDLSSDSLSGTPSSGLMELLLNIGSNVMDEPHAKETHDDEDDEDDEDDQVDVKVEDPSSAKVVQLVIGLDGSYLRIGKHVNLIKMVMPTSIACAHSQLWIGDGTTNNLVCLKTRDTPWNMELQVPSVGIAKILSVVSVPVMRMRCDDVLLFEAIDKEEKASSSGTDIHVFKPRWHAGIECNVQVYAQISTSMCQSINQEGGTETKEIMKSLETVILYLQSIDQRLMRLEQKVDGLIR